MSGIRCIRLEAEKEYPLPAEKLWELLTRTNQLQALAGGGPVEYEHFGGGHHILYQRASIRGFLGRRLRWREYPYEWVKNRSFLVLKEFDRGLFSRYRWGIDLEPTEQGTKVKIFAELSPRWFVLRPFVIWHGERFIKTVQLYCDQFLALWIHRHQYVFPNEPLKQVRSKSWAKRLAEFSSSNPQMGELLEKLKEHLIESADDDVTQMRPKELADQWGAGHDQVVRLFLYAVKEGLLQLNLTVSCPICRLPQVSVRSIVELPPKVTCSFCQRPFEVDLDECTELRFSVHPNIRPTQGTVFSRNGPRLTPQVWIQRYLAPGAVWKTEAMLGEERFRCRTLRTNQICQVVPSTQHSSEITRLRLLFTREGWLSKEIRFRPGKQEIEFRNESHTPILVALEKVERDRLSFNGAQAFATSEFQYLFPNEIPMPGRRLRIRRCNLLLTDVKGSTELFTRLGDHGAINRLQHVLSFIVQVIQSHHGAVVKLMGDEVMALFWQPENAVQAAFCLQSQIASLNDSQKLVPPVELRVALHRGSAVALFRGGKLDYFGESVNRAFQIKRRSAGGEVAMSQSLFQDLHVQQVLKEYVFDNDVTAIERTGSEETFKVCHLLPMFKKANTDSTAPSSAAKAA